MSSTDQTGAAIDAGIADGGASDWSATTQQALKDTKVESATVPNAEGGILGPNDSAVDTSAKSQAEVERNLPTPGVSVPGAWTDAPVAGAQQVVADAQAGLASLGSVAYNAIPDGVKQSLSSEPGTTSISEQASDAATSAQSTAADVASSTANSASAAATTIAGTATAVANGIYSTIFGAPAGQESIDKSAEVMPSHAPATLPSQDRDGQQPFEAMDGVGALPGTAHETGVAVLPDEKGGVDLPVTDVPTQSTVSEKPTIAEQTTLAGVAVGSGLSAAASKAYQSASEVAQNLPGAPKTLSNADGETMPVHESHTLPSQDKLGQLPLTQTDGVGVLPGSDKEESVALLPHERQNPDPSYVADQSFDAAKKNTPAPYSNEDATQSSEPSSVPKDTSEAAAKNTPDPYGQLGEGESQTSSGTPGKASFLDKVKGQAKIVSGKLSGNQEKIEEGRAIKSGQA